MMEKSASIILKASSGSFTVHGPVFRISCYSKHGLLIQTYPYASQDWNSV
jgi:hypothetical protein